MKQFEYEVIKYNTFSGVFSILNEWGKYGWEVCAYNSNNDEILLKREIEDDK